MGISWTLLIDLGVVSCALLLATFLRAKVPFFQKYLIPNALTAGFILLPFYNYLAPAPGPGQGQPREPRVPPPEPLLHRHGAEGRVDEGVGKADLRHGHEHRVALHAAGDHRGGHHGHLHGHPHAEALPQLRLLPRPRVRPRARPVVRHRQVLGSLGVRRGGQPRPHLRGHGLHLGLHRRHLPHQPRPAQGLDRQARRGRAQREGASHRHLRPQGDPARRLAAADGHRGDRLAVLQPRAGAGRVHRRLPLPEADHLAHRHRRRHGQAVRRQPVGHLVHLRRHDRPCW